MEQVEGRRTGRSQWGHAKPETYEELLAVLSAGMAGLPRRSREVAVHLTQHPDDVALCTISELAQAAGVQPSTLVRFAQVFGFSGWSEFQELFKTHLRGGFSLRRSEGVALPQRMVGLVEAAQASLTHLPETLDIHTFDRVAAALAESPAVTLLGSKRAFPVAAYLSLTLAQHGVRNSLIGNLGSTAEVEIGCLGPGDCLLAISFSPYNSATPDLARLARDRGTRVLALTDTPLSPLVPLSEDSLFVVEKADAGYRTLAATMTVALALATEVAARRLRR
jgi:DNA-binding MurR/RpiR family transcriptional regulator